MNRLIILAGFFICLISCNNKEKQLPIYGQKDFIEGIDKDTIYHTIPQWSFVNQNGDFVNSSDYLGDIYVVYFFFTHCPSICPAMTKNVVNLQQKAINLDIKFLSYTVDPEKDSSERLKWYENTFGINGKNWNLLTGDQQSIYELGVNGYLVPNQEDALSPGGFLHSEKVMLVDKKGRIRGSYDGTDSDQIDKLFEDILILKNER